MPYTDYYKARDIVDDILFKDLVGPVKPDEKLTEMPTQYYIMGKLYPRSTNHNTPSQDLESDDLLENPIEEYDSPIASCNQMTPSSMAITFAIKSGIQTFNIRTSFAVYARQENIGTKEHGNVAPWMPTWERTPFQTSNLVNLSDDSNIREFSVGNETYPAFLKIYIRKTTSDGNKIITAVLENTAITDDSAEQIARFCLFQPEISVSSEHGEELFAALDQESHLANDQEILELELLYRHAKCFAQGHGCSVTWDTSSQTPAWIKSTWFPTYDLRQMMAAKFSDLKAMGMEFLSQSAPQAIISQLKTFAQRYDAWISNQIDDISEIPTNLQDVANKNMDACKAASSRIKNAINLLAENSQAMTAFKLANKAMFLQRAETLKTKGNLNKLGEITWYPFQLAFILHELPSFITPTCPDRNLADLLWFPTGGGKTEAYLGIAAFVIFLRRLRNLNDDGVTVIMRYTLRLLTMQQFERATRLIIACERLRLLNPMQLGEKEISIGLWVGQTMTPNTIKSAKLALKKAQNNLLSEDDLDPCQLAVCPWCHAQLSPDDYSIDENNYRLEIHCPNPQCITNTFSHGIPVHIIDEAIYHHLPTFIIATVDKFAQLPLQAEPAKLFGIGSRSKRNPPDLIIQDELHLISGPLGTITGIYEAAITKLCEKDGVYAKVIASTATIRNAKKQILSLYGRDFTQFPPQGLSAKDSFFAIEANEDERPTRRYCGILGIGTTQTTSLIRTNAALLFATRFLAVQKFSDEVIDNFWTLVGYFNTLRKLGGASTQMQDDVQSRFEYLAKTKFSYLCNDVNKDRYAEMMGRRYEYNVELTSRSGAATLSQVLQHDLNIAYGQKERPPLDYVLASNMISVGVDVGRLGVMVVAGQPKTNAEYIQATSRVGRENPGLVISVYGNSNSRDRSHYEQFMKYHLALYRYVEATSLTPFSDRARDRGLHALYVSLVRYLVPGMLWNGNASRFNPDEHEVKEIRRYIEKYVERVDPDELKAVSSELSDIENEWSELITKYNGQLVYKLPPSSQDQDSTGQGQLLEADTNEESRFRTMNSMRNVDAQSNIYL